ncbi:hypothetical protein BH09PAT1_BH09PAT1_8550 [soil metagenome]
MYKFEKLIVWQKSLFLIKEIYKETEKLNDFVIKDQVRRAVTSIAINIAEGSGSEGDKEFKRYLFIAIKSLFETLACLKILHFMNDKDYTETEKNIDEVGKLLNGLINKVKSDI